jgi:hypothetical protein
MIIFKYLKVFTEQFFSAVIAYLNYRYIKISDDRKTL